MSFLLSIVENLCQADLSRNPIINGSRMLSAIVTICCLDEMIPKCITHSDVPRNHVSALLSLLRLTPDVQNRRCADWDYLTAYIPRAFHKTVSEAVLAFTVDLSHTEYFNLPTWMFAIPVIHFLRSDSVPFQEIEFNPKNIPWGDKLLGLDDVRRRTYTNRDVK